MMGMRPGQPFSWTAVDVDPKSNKLRRFAEEPSGDFLAVLEADRQSAES
jgi:hypothetical protein